jgi:hypothetical protein
MTATTAFAALAPGLLVMLLSAGAGEQQEKPTENPDKRLALSKKNAAAEELESLVLALGLDAHRTDPSAQHPSREDLDAYQHAGFGSWLDAQLRTADDSIAAVPASIQSFLEKRQPTLWRVVGLLERDFPQWDSAPREEPRDLSGVTLAVFLARVLTAAALVEERAGRHVQAGELLEATWSLSRSLSGEPVLISRLIAVALGRFQAGALRKMSEPPVPWLDRMSGVEPWRGILDAIEADHRHSVRDDAEPDDSRRAYERAWSAATDPLRELSPCEVSKLSSDEIWKPAQDELDRWQEAKGDPGPKAIFALASPNQTGAIRRAGRLLVDRELTAKVLELRQEKAASRDGQWPAKFSDLDSRVCPGSSYEYQARGAAMAIRFKGPIDDGGATLVLPLYFEVRAPRPTPTPTRARRPTPTSRPRS